MAADTGLDTIATALTGALPADRVVTDPDVLASYAHDEAEWAPWQLPAALVRPRSAEEVQTVVRLCIEHRVPVVPRGAGTGLSGGANATAGSVVLSLERMDAVLQVDELERYAVVQPGVVNDALRAHVARFGLWYPPDPASSPWSTIGGNVATNAGGLCCVKYGVTRDYVLGLQVVTGTGELVRLGRRTAKGVAGGRAVPAVAAAGLTPSALELVDRECLRAVDAWKNMGLSADAAVVLLGRVDTPGAAGDAEAAAMLGCFEGAGATFAAVSSDQAEADALFAARRLAYPALERLGPVLTEDVCVPKGAVPEMLARIEAIAARHDTRIANVAHAGDGNLHPLLITPVGDDAARTRAQSAFEEIISAALALGGTVTGEHGVGLLKRGGLRAELAPAVLEMHRAVKAALDPHGILNPGKVI